jgi:hypothetical protein
LHFHLKKQGRNLSQRRVAGSGFHLLPDGIISTALNLLAGKPQGIKAAETILVLPDFDRLPHQVIVSVLDITKQHPLALKAARVIVNKGIIKQTFCTTVTAFLLVPA